MMFYGGFLCAVSAYSYSSCLTVKIHVNVTSLRQFYIGYTASFSACVRTSANTLTIFSTGNDVILL